MSLPPLADLPRLGVGISAEPGSFVAGIDPTTFASEHPGLIHFVEYGSDAARGLDDAILRWSRAGGATTYHFLDLNLEDDADLDEEWLEQTRRDVAQIGAAWLCGDSGLWHFGRRDRGHELLLPPLLTKEGAHAVAHNLRRLEQAIELRVLPENPPSAFYVGDLHLLDYYAAILGETGSGMLLDCGHLAMYQHLHGHAPTTGLDGFPIERIVELHVAGSTPRDLDGLIVFDDTHSPELLPETWTILQTIVPRATNLRAITFECEKNPAREVLGTFAQLNRLFPKAVA